MRQIFCHSFFIGEEHLKGLGYTAAKKTPLAPVPQWRCAMPAIVTAVIDAENNAQAISDFLNIFCAPEPQIYERAIRRQVGAFGGSEHQTERVVMA